MFSVGVKQDAVIAIFKEAGVGGDFGSAADPNTMAVAGGEKLRA